MGGKHQAPDRRRLYRDILRHSLLLTVVLVVAVGGALVLSWALGSSGDVIDVADTTRTDTTTSVLSATLATQASTTTSTTIATTTTTLPPR